MRDEDQFDDEPQEKSKSQMKREMHALQAMGEALANLRKEQRAAIPMGDRLRAALDDWSRITQHEARRRHLQFIGKLMRQEDEEVLQAALDRFDASSQRNVEMQHTVERWRDRFLTEEGDVVTEFMVTYPDTDAQHLRSLIRMAKKEAEGTKNLGHRRKLFRLVRDIIDPS